MAKRPNRNWTREEHILAFNLYCTITFGSIDMRNPQVIELAHLIGRTVGSVSRKLANFARLDPALQARGISGLPHGAHGEEEVWHEFVDHPEALAFESEQLRAGRLGVSVTEVAEVDDTDLPAAGLEREAIVRVRVNQSFFRRRVISLFESQCCVSGLRTRELLVASHIIPWAEDVPNRLNPRNGLCLNALHDRAFDRGLMWIEEGFIIRFSKRLVPRRKIPDDTLAWLTSFEGQPLHLPKRFSPDPDLLRRHAGRSAN
ncbi:MAG TPA: HNH endonuclease [Planctomycetaceae bacterium]|jgi:putative restriction endonuclease